MWVWSKLSAIKWEDAWEERFHGNPNAVLTHLKGGKSLRVDVYCKLKREADEIAENFGGSVRKLVEKNWHAVKESPPPLKIRDSLVITQEGGASALKKLRAEFAERVLVSIPPEMAFGTGDHATTANCLRFLADEARERTREGKPWRMLDLGCGTGVLAIAANLLGASECDAMDYDPKAVEVAKRNAERNGAKEVTVTEGDVLKWSPRRRYGLVAANLFSSVLKEAFPKMRKALAEGGHVIFSGVLRSQWEETRAAAEEAGLTILETRIRGKWVSALARGN